LTPSTASLVPTSAEPAGIAAPTPKPSQSRELGIRCSAGKEPNLESGNDALGDFVLDSEDIHELAVVSLGPNMPSRGAIHQLGSDPNSVSGLSHTAFDYIVDIQLASYITDFCRLALEHEGRMPRD